MIKIECLNLDSYVIPIMLINLNDVNIISIPTQLGCLVNCEFCISSSKKFIRNLTFDELKNSIYSVLNSDKKTIISFTGEGEPSLNLNTVQLIINYFEKHTCIVGFKISSSGIKMEKLKFLNSIKPIELQFSLHFTDDVTRRKYIKHTISINEILYNLKNYDNFKDISINYVVFDGLNDFEYNLEFLLTLPKNYLIKLNEVLSYNSFVKSKKINYFYSKLLSNDNRVVHYQNIAYEINTSNLFEKLTYIDI